MNLYQRPDSKVWWMDATHPVTGKRLRRSTDKTKRSEASKAAAEILQELVRKASEKPTNEITLDEAMRLRVERLVAEGRAYARNARAIHDKVFARGTFTGRWGLPEGLLMSAIEPSQMALLVTKRRAEGASEQTIAHEIKDIRAAVRSAVTLGYDAPTVMVAGGAASAWAAPRLTSKTRYLSPEEFQLLRGELEQGRTVTKSIGPDHAIAMRANDRLALEVALVLVMTGARWAEVAGLQWRQVDRTTFDTLTIYGSKTERERLVPVPVAVQGILRDRYKARFGRGNSTYVFAPDTGDMPTPHNVGLLIRQAMDRCGLNSDPLVVKRHGKATVHSLRHTCASWLLQSNEVDLVEVQTILGHSKSDMTQRYAHLSKGKTARRLAGVLDAVMPSEGVAVAAVGLPEPCPV